MWGFIVNLNLVFRNLIKGIIMLLSKYVELLVFKFF